MKKIIYSLAVVVALVLTTETSKAQAWEKSSKVLALGIGGSSFFHIDKDYYDYYYGYYGYYGRRFPYSFLTGQLNLQGEFGVHDYVGVGFTTGIGGRAGWGWYSNGEVNMPIGAIANFHFYQLIADKTGKDIHSDKLDVYAGVNIGSGFAAVFRPYDNNRVIPIVWGGVQAGARYYFTDKFGVNLEVGYGKSIVNGGIVFKL